MALRLKTHFCHIQGRSHRRCHPTSKSPRDDMRDRTIRPIRIQQCFERLVDGELDGGEGYAHGEGGGVGDTERGEPLGGVDGFGAGKHCSMGGVEDLHALFDDCGLQRAIRFVIRYRSSAHHRKGS